MAFTKQHIRFLSVMTTTFLMLFGLLIPALAFGSPPVLANRDRNFTAGSRFYQQTNLVSDVPGLAKFTDSHLANPWGISFSSTSPFWISDYDTGFSTLYNGQGQPVPPGSPLAVAIPSNPGNPHPGTPTGTVYNSTNSFVIQAGKKSGPSRFLFATFDGTISGWNPAVDPTHAIVAVNRPTSAVYVGLAIGTNPSGTFLYAANVFGSIDVFDQKFALAHLQGSFHDPNLPAGYFPYNIQNLGGQLWVTYAGLNTGYVDVYDTEGNLIRRVVSADHLYFPWGLAIAPAHFGQFSNDLLVGNTGSGLINAYDPHTGRFLGQLRDKTGKPIVLEGLWGLAFGNGGSGGDRNTLYFTAGIYFYYHGLFGSLTAQS
jgi:uncharacterized protein (TIGR03118 family)